MSVRRLAKRSSAAAFIVLASAIASTAQSAGSGSSAAGAPPSYSQSPAGSDAPSGGSGLGGRLPAHEGGVPGGPESERRIPETKSRYTTCPDGSRGDLNAGGCLGGGR